MSEASFGWCPVLNGGWRMDIWDTSYTLLSWGDLARSDSFIFRIIQMLVARVHVT